MQTMLIRFLFCVFFAFTLIVNSPLISSELQYDCSEKVYISPDRILVTGEGIFIADETDLFPVQSIEYDGKGINCKPIGWFCPRCKFPNGGSPPCRRCDWPNPDKRK